MRRPLLLALLLLLLVPAAARADSDQVMTFEAPGALLDERCRESTLDEIQSFGVSRVRALVYWREFTAQPHARSPCRRFDTSDSERLPRGHLGPARPARRLGPEPRDGAAADAHRARADVGDEAQAAAARPTRARSLFGRWVRAVATRYARPGEPVVDLERAEPPELPRPAVQGRQAPHAEALPQALRRRRGRDPRHAGQRARQGPVRRDRADRQPERRLAARLPPRRAVPERGLREAQGLQEAADRRLRPPRLHAQGRPDVRARPTPTRSASARSAG